MSNTNMHSTAAPSNRRLWYGVTAATFAWALQGLICWIISEAACRQSHVATLEGMSVAGLQALTVGISVVALAVAISGLAVSWRTWRSLATREFVNVQAWGRGEFMAFAGVFVSTMFSIAIIWGGLAPLLTGLCEAVR